MIRTFLVVFLLFCATRASAQPAEEPPLEPLYERIADDLKAGKPLVVVAHYGMWQVRAHQPERNLNWGVYYGHATMLKRAKKDPHIAKNFEFHDWEPVLEKTPETPTEDVPLRTLVFAQTVLPNTAWNTKQVTKPFRVYLVMYAWESQTAAALAATNLMRRGQGEVLELEDKTLLDTTQAQATGYFGHNFFYDYEDFFWPGLAQIPGQLEKPMGTFSVGCNTARVPGFEPWFEDPNTYALLFSKSLMASEGYSTLALMDGLMGYLQGKELVELGDRTYQYFQKLGKPERRVGKPFVTRGFKLKP